MRNVKDPSGHSARWSLCLQEYDLKIVYKTSFAHQNANALSRCPLQPTASDDDDATEIPVGKFSAKINIATEQRNNPKLQSIIQLLHYPFPRSRTAKMGNMYTIVDPVLYRRDYEPTEQPLLVVIPRHLRSDVVCTLYDDPTAGHLGEFRKYNQARSRFFFLFDF